MDSEKVIREYEEMFVENYSAWKHIVNTFNGNLNSFSKENGIDFTELTFNEFCKSFLKIMEEKIKQENKVDNKTILDVLDSMAYNIIRPKISYKNALISERAFANTFNGSLGGKKVVQP